MSRKTFIQTTSLAATGMFITPGFMSQPNTLKIKALAFDAFAIFDPRPIFKTVEALFPDQGKQLTQIWQHKQFSYQWLRLLGNKYKNFWDITKDALNVAFVQCGINDKEKEKALIMAKYENISVWPDVTQALRQIKQENITVCLLSNMTAKMLHRGIENASLNKYFDFVISTDERETYKPSPKAYQVAVEKLRIRKEEILFVPFAGWDLAGAKWFGYPTFWLNRLNSSPEMLDAEPDGQGNNLDELLEFVRKYNRKH
ncbi:MAG: haloacid dehalogenase type II [Bacteroidetes bacterium]|nr:MAG: haloacid dehalogenase type II [Bacteroidota bacterium]